MNVSIVEPSRDLDDSPWRSGRVPDGYWRVRNNRVRYLDWLGQHLGLASRDDWYQVGATDFIRNHGGFLFWLVYDSSMFIVMQDYLPQCEWLAWLFSKTPRGFWQEAENRRAYMEWLEGALQVRSEEDWYQVTRKSFTENGGGGLLRNHYRGSILSVVSEYRPDYDWKPWLFPKVPHGFWQEAENRRAYMEWLERALQVKSDEDWYQVTRESFTENGGSGLLGGHYRGSILSVLSEYRPNYDWKPWLFPKVPNGFWNQPGNRRRYFEWLAGHLRFRSVSDWHLLTKQDLLATGGFGLFGSHYRSSMARLRKEVVAMKFSERPESERRERVTQLAQR